MQATIIYLLTEQAQRAAMAATGQPVMRKQTISIDIPSEELEFYPVAADGTITVDLINSTNIVGHRIDAGPFGETPNVPDLVRQAIAREEATKQKKLAQFAENLVKQLAAVEKFLSDPTLRCSISDIQMGYTHIGATRIDRDESDYHPACPSWAEMRTEAERRNAIDAEARKQKDAEDQLAKAAKDAAEAAKEKSKLDYINVWIAEHGTETQKAMQADGVLCRETAIHAIADYVFSPATALTEGSTFIGIVVYSANHRPSPKCSNEERDCHDCAVKYAVEDACDCLSEAEYSNYSSIRAALPDATYILRTHTAIHDCDHSPDCKTGENHGCMVKLTVGPFVLQREYAL